jgi:multimeric flavodoxin WrbA
VIDDDMQPLYPLLRWADAIVFGSPVYMGTITAQLKAIFDRARPLWRQPGGLLHKAAAAVVVGEGRWGRQEHAFQTIYWAALNHGMVIPGPDCEVCGVADAPGDIQRDAQALAAADDLGRRLARMTLRLG